ncbi:MAG: hypothetical protein QOC81_4571 [Thermoanaerobaculia bacterium]|jgi:predicted transcriptional regulator|nr:hypothetical protein [Thermoanaerobaculia bacterium]
MHMNVTLSVDDEVLARASELASRRGTSLDRMVGDYLKELASDWSPDEIMAELNALWSVSTGDSGGKRWTREELHERSGVR